MNAREAIKSALTSTQSMLGMYLNDLSDADLLVRPVPGANHIALQLGHLISSEVGMVRGQLPAALYPELPPGFAEAHDLKNAGKDGPAGFLKKADYLGLF